MKKNSHKYALMSWAAISILFIVISYIIYIGTHTGAIFFLVLHSINLTLFIIVILFRRKIEKVAAALINKFEEISEASTKISVKLEYAHEKKIGTMLVSAVVLFGIYIIFLASTDVESYSFFIKEDGPAEYGSFIFWIFAAITLSFSLIRQSNHQKIHRYNFLTYLILILFLIVCAGEEISWGQRLFGIETPEILKSVNVQNEITLHNIGSISIFSNIFFLLTIFYFLGIHFFVKKFKYIKNFIHFHLLPVPNLYAVYVFLISLIIWLFVGIRFGTLGFHPFSFFEEGYYNQMDDEVFELLASYSFFSYSLMDVVKKIKIT